MKHYNYPSECIDDGQPISRYYEQWPAAVPQVGRVYATHPGRWNECRYRIVYVGHGIALGICEGSPQMGNLNKGDAALFHAEGCRTGWQYDDIRAGYRLREAPANDQ